MSFWLKKIWVVGENKKRPLFRKALMRMCDLRYVICEVNKEAYSLIPLRRDVASRHFRLTSSSYFPHFFSCIIL